MAIPLIQNVEKQDINTSIIAIRRQLEQLYNALGVTESTVSSEDISKSTGTPLGTWASFENDYAPNIEWLQGGTTFNPNTYPALAMYLGGNVVPIMYDHNRLGELESITISTNSSSPNVAEYDGILYVGLGVNGSRKLWINGVMFGCISGSDGGANSYELKKGDVFYGNSGINFAKVAYYKHPMFIKATPTSSDTDYEGTLNAIRQYVSNSNSYSTEEVWTGGYWIDGKKIYRRVFHFDTTCSQATNWALPYAEKIVNAYLTIKGQSYVCCSPYTFVTSGTSSWGQAGLTVRCSWSDNSGWSSSNGEVIFEYTKSSD